MDRRRRVGFAALGLVLLLLLLWWLRPDAAVVGGADEVARPAAAVDPPAPAAAEARRPERPEADPAPQLLDEATAALDEEARAEALRNDPDVMAICTIQPAVPAGRFHLINGDDVAPPYDGRLLPVIGSEAFVGHVAPEGHGWLAVEGYEPVSISWSDGRCQPDPVVLPEGTAWLTGHVRNAEGEPEGKVFVEGCGTQARTDGGGHYAMAVRPGPCTLGAFRRDGLLFSAAESQDVSPAAGIELVVDFELPELPKAGLGVVIEQTDEGIRILDVLPGTAAYDAGLKSGDVFIEVDGTATAGLPLQDFIDLAVGEVGTEVEVVIGRGETEERWLLDRRVLEEQG